ncbi:MAG: type II secretion system GspH family protein [Fusobacterium sp.]|nr:type II secretion system GspH family protein [Fusobacterium sp.]
MAEILLSLTIIGVVAAITLPSLTGNINERTWNTQRKALYARMSQAIALMPALNGYGQLAGSIGESHSQTITKDNVTETFITSGLSKVLKINNICDSEHIDDCGVPLKFTNLTAGGPYDMPRTMTQLNPLMTYASYNSYTGFSANSFEMLDTKAAAFETGNGESILTFYNPNCVANMGESTSYFVQPKICVNMIYDLNGSKGPNTVGKDIGFMTILYPTDSVVVAPMPYRTPIPNVTSTAAATECTKQAGDDYRIPTKDELASLFANRQLIDEVIPAYHWYSSSKIVRNTSITSWVMVAAYGEYRIPSAGVSSWGVLCVKR